MNYIQAKADMIYCFLCHPLIVRHQQLKLKRYIYAIVSGLFLSGPVIADEIIVWNRTYDQTSMIEVLQLALDKTINEGPYQLLRSVDMEQGRAINELQKSKRVHVAAFAPTTEREEAMIAVRVPVSKGLLGFRVCLIRAGEEGMYKNIHSIDDWIKNDLSMGQGTHWPDTQILESNGLKVVKSVRYKPLFHMLKKNRFDCFPRSVNEVQSELENSESEDLALEKYLVFQYRLPTFFFVNINKPLLAERIDRGLNIAIQDGSFDELFNKLHWPTLKKVNLQGRRVIHLSNSFLSEETQKIVGKSELWLNPLK